MLRVEADELLQEETSFRPKVVILLLLLLLFTETISSRWSCGSGKVL